MISMAIKYVVLPEKKQVIAILSNTRFDAYNKVMKLCRKFNEGQSTVFICPNPDKFMMPNEFKVTVNCLEEDEFNVEEGKLKAKERLLKNYYKSFDKRIEMFLRDTSILQNNIVIPDEYKVIK